MARVLTESHKRKLARGRELAQARKRAAQLAAVAAYQEWLKHESLAYEDLINARAIYGEDSWDAREAEAAWHETLGEMPSMDSLPPDPVMRALRGEVTDLE